MKQSNVSLTTTSIALVYTTMVFNSIALEYVNFNFLIERGGQGNNIDQALLCVLIS